ncbi:MAG: hypothetical protein ACKO92_00100, partial [Actinomycetota bacterium]
TKTARATIAVITSTRRGAPCSCRNDATLVCQRSMRETIAVDRVSRIERWQTKVASFLQEQGAPRLVLVMSAIVALAVLVSRAGKREKVGS